MGLEAATHISDLVSTNPTGTDQKLQGDDHIRMIKSVLKTDFPNINAAVTGTPAQLNAFSGLFPFTAGDFISASGASTLQKRSAAQVRSDVGADNASNLTSGTIPEARLPATLSLTYNFDTVELKFGQALTAFPAGMTQCAIYRAGAFAGAPSGFATGTAGHLILQGRSNAASALGVLLVAGQSAVDQAIVFGVRPGVAQVVGDNVELRLGATDDFALYHDGTNNNIDSNTGSLNFRDSAGTIRAVLGTTGLLVTPAAGPASTEVGFRKIVRETTGGTLTAGMNGTCQAVSANVTVNNSVHAAGDAIQIYNDSAATITIIQGAGVTMRLAGTTTTGTRTLAVRGLAMLWFNSASEVIVSGNVS